MISRLLLLASLCLCLTVQAEELLADRVIVNKSERKLYLMNQSEVLRSYDISLGLMPEGHKQQEGDFRTPEGDYFLTSRLVESDYFMAIQVSYPNSADMARARGLGVSPGGQIMIHGQPGKPRKSAAYYSKYDWTDGCVAVSNAAMVDIWQLTRPNTPITILP